MRFDTPHGCAVSSVFVAHALIKVVDGRVERSAPGVVEPIDFRPPEWRPTLGANATN